MKLRCEGESKTIDSPLFPDLPPLASCPSPEPCSYFSLQLAIDDAPVTWRSANALVNQDRESCKMAKRWPGARRISTAVGDRSDLKNSKSSHRENQFWSSRGLRTRCFRCPALCGMKVTNQPYNLRSGLNRGMPTIALYAELVERTLTGCNWLFLLVSTESVPYSCSVRAAEVYPETGERTQRFAGDGSKVESLIHAAAGKSG